jgi:hypothetical protein
MGMGAYVVDQQREIVALRQVQLQGSSAKLIVRIQWTRSLVHASAHACRW